MGFQSSEFGINLSSMKNMRKKLGMTLVEVVIAIGIFSIMMLAITALFASLWKSQEFSINMSENSLQASRGATNIADSIRNARQADNGSYPIVSIMDNEIVFFGDMDDDAATERIRIWRDGDKLYRGTIQPQGSVPVSYPSSSEIVSVIALNIVDNPDTTPLFVYYNEFNDKLSAPLVGSSVRMVETTVTIDADTDKPPTATTVNTFASIRNLRAW